METFFLLITCGLQYFAIIPITLPYMNIKIPFFNSIYTTTIISSIIFSILYHYTNYSIFYLIDCLIIGLWFGQDILWSYLINKPIIIYLNIGIFVLNILFNYLNYNVFYHCIWHIISAIKSYYISMIICIYDKI